MESLGLFVIYRESYNIITTWRKIFTQIILAYILPSYLISMASQQVSYDFFWNIFFENYIHQTAFNQTTDFNQSTSSTAVSFNETQQTEAIFKEPYSNIFSSESAPFWLFQLACFDSVLIFYLLSTSACIYTVACIRTDREVTFKKVAAVIPKVLKRLIFTSLCTFIAFIPYIIGAILIIIASVIFIAVVISTDSLVVTVSGCAVIALLLLVYLAGFVYLGIVWQLANVVSVLEEAQGFKAMKKSKQLLKGKIWLAVVIFFSLLVLSYSVQTAFEKMVMHGWSLGMVVGFAFQIICSMLPMVLSLFQLVIQTLLYFVCKFYHDENINKLVLSNHLDKYVLGEHVPLKTREEVQLEKFNHV